MEELSEADLRLKEDLANNFLEISRKLLPGISRLKGTTLYELFLTMKQRATLALNLANPDQIDVKESILGLVGGAGMHLQNCIDCLKYEPLHRPEGQLHERAIQDRLTVQQLIQHTQQ